MPPASQTVARVVVLESFAAWRAGSLTDHALVSILVASQPLRPIDGVVQNGVGVFDEGGHAAMLRISGGTVSVRCSTAGTWTRLSHGMATTRNSGLAASVRTSLRITTNRMPGVLARCRITTPSTPWSCDLPAAMPANSRTGASVAIRVALPSRSARQRAHTGQLCAKGGRPSGSPTEHPEEGRVREDQRGTGGRCAHVACCQNQIGRAHV